MELIIIADWSRQEAIGCRKSNINILNIEGEEKEDGKRDRTD